MLVKNIGLFSLMQMHTKEESLASFVNFSGKLTGWENSAVIFEKDFLVILFPVDQFVEMGPCSRSLFTDTV